MRDYTNAAPETMKSLFLLIALYTITGKQAVPSGDIPAIATCAYEQSGSRSGQMTAGNDIMLTLGGYDGMMLQSVTLEMKSNKSAGAGELLMSVGNSLVWNITNASFSDKTWNGAYTDEWVNISHPLGGLVVPDGAPIVLHITASANSLYLQSVAIDYQAPHGETFTVAFNTYSSERLSPLTEASPNAGITLPEVPVSDPKWKFYGWASEPVEETTAAPQVHLFNTIYHPDANCTLHAVYRRATEQEPWFPTDDLTLGDYVIALYNQPTGTVWCATGAVDNGMLATVRLDYSGDEGWIDLPHSMGSSEAVYTLGISGDTLTIKHKATKTAVVLAATGKFAKSSTANNAWIISACETDADDMPQFAISGTAGEKMYYVSYYVDNGTGTIYLRPTTDASMVHNLLLFALSDMVETPAVYSSYAFGSAVENIGTYTGYTYRLNMGPYILTISNGKKYLQINE